MSRVDNKLGSSTFLNEKLLCFVEQWVIVFALI